MHMAFAIDLIVLVSHLDLMFCCFDSLLAEAVMVMSQPIRLLFWQSSSSRQPVLL